ncbi:MAG TPA: M1 family peptidase, partial [Candidatus Eisenbacteria bacterium]|nr:M1 family peptidase [Candidatus Eisenbacteria bacterium]
VLHGTAAAQGPASQDLLSDYWQQRADYDIRCTLDIEAKMLTGIERLTYTNNSPDTLRRYFIHLYPNAYRSADSELYRDFHPGTWVFLRDLPEENRGWLEIDTMTVGGEPASFTIDGTVLAGDFPRPLPPGGTVIFDMAFREKIRKRIGRAGYLGNHYDMAQWYPKIAVYDKTGWHQDQFRTGEFYGEFGTYEVSITLPDQYVIAATGLPVEGDPGWTRNEKPEHKDGGGHPGADAGVIYGTDSSGMKQGRDDAGLSLSPKTVRFRAVDVHDFAWCADPLFVVEEAKVGAFSVMSFYRQWNSAWADSALARTVNAVRLLDSLVGPYGWPQISIVDSPTHGGMEYPMLVMNGSPDMSLIVHEVTHMWFYGMLANNERDDAWLDEGPAQYFMFDWLAASTGRKDLWNRIGDSVIELHRSGFAEPVATPYHEFESSGLTMVYNKSALFLRALRIMVGDEVFEEILREYFSNWKFRHVDGETFLAVCEDVTGLELDDFFKQWIYSAKTCDYTLDRFKRREEDGLHWADLRIKRRGDMILPITLEFRLADGTVVQERLDGMPREIEKSFSFESKPE